MNKTIGVLAHVDAGKTTFCEQLLYHTNSIKQRGRVDHQNTFLDTHDIEKKRGITVFSDQAIISYKDSKYYLVDTPGHVDFSPEMERAIKIMDYAIIIVSAVEGVQGHTETVWQLLEKHNIPTFFFINKTDRVGADVEGVIDEIAENLTGDVCYIKDNLKNGNIKEDLIEFMAERDEKLFEKYLEEDYDFEIWLNSLRTMIKDNKVYPCMSGSALHDEGIIDFFENLDLLSYTKYLEKEKFSGRVYKIKYDEEGVRITFLKIISGQLNVRDEINYIDGENKICEKITQIRAYNGGKYINVNNAKVGELIAVTGLSQVRAGDGLGNLKEKEQYENMTTLRAKVIFDPKLNLKDVLKVFKILNIEDPSLNVTWQEKLEEIHIHVMGVIQLEVLEQLIKSRFGYNVTFGTPEILYKETVDSPTIGYGHFEPLRHYAEVHIKIEPNKRGKGIVFENVCHPDMLTVGNQNLIKRHIYEREHHGLLTGSSLTDLKITLLTGRSHNKHTSGGDFRQATYRALRQGLEKVKNVLLEPYYDFKIKVEQDYMGRVLSDIQKNCGTFDSPKAVGNNVVITGRVPVATFMDYSKQLTSFTKGKGKINLKFSGYDCCHNQQEVIEKIGYNKSADPEYTSSSIFCSKGKAYTVTWDKCEEEMHCL